MGMAEQVGTKSAGHASDECGCGTTLQPSEQRFPVEQKAYQSRELLVDALPSPGTAVTHRIRVTTHSTCAQTHYAHAHTDNITLRY